MARGAGLFTGIDLDTDVVVGPWGAPIDLDFTARQQAVLRSSSVTPEISLSVLSMLRTLTETATSAVSGTSAPAHPPTRPGAKDHLATQRLRILLAKDDVLVTVLIDMGHEAMLPAKLPKPKPGCTVERRTCRSISRFRTDREPAWYGGRRIELPTSPCSCHPALASWNILTTPMPDRRLTLSKPRDQTSLRTAFDHCAAPCSGSTSG